MENKYYKLKRNVIIKENVLLRCKTLVTRNGTKIYKDTLFTEDFVTKNKLTKCGLFILAKRENDIEEERIVNSGDDLRELFKDDYGNIVVQKSNTEVMKLSGRNSLVQDSSKLESLTNEKEALEKQNKELLEKIKGFGKQD